MAPGNLWDLRTTIGSKSGHSLVPSRSSARLPLCKSSSRAGVGLESDEFFVDAFDSAGDHTWDPGFSSGPGSEDSGEVCIDRFTLEEASTYDAQGSVLEQRPTWPGGHRPALPSGQVAPGKVTDRGRLD